MQIWISRLPLNLQGRGNYHRVPWVYSFSVDGRPEVDYGRDLASLRDFLRRRYPGAQIVESWKQREPNSKES